MAKFSLLILLISGLLMADSGTWKSFQASDKIFTVSFPCSGSNILIKTDDNKKERLYKCEFAGSTYSLTQEIFTEAGKKQLQLRPSTLIEDTSRDLAKKYKNEGITVEVNKIFRQFPYRILNFVGSGNKMKYYTTIFDSAETRIVFSGSGPETEDSNLKKASDSIKPN